MESKDEKMRDRLLSHLPQPENAEAYRKEVAALLEKNARTFLRQKRASFAIWIFCVGLSAAFLWFGDRRGHDAARTAWYGSLACFWLIYGAVDLLKYFINRNRVELMKEVKQVQLQILELHELVAKR
jgi:hypothetical protein